MVVVVSCVVVVVVVLADDWTEYQLQTNDVTEEQETAFVNQSVLM